MTTTWYGKGEEEDDEENKGQAQGGPEAGKYEHDADLQIPDGTQKKADSEL